MKDSYYKTLARLAIKDINPDEEYSLLSALRFIPFIRDARTLKDAIKRGNINARVVKGKTENGDRYFIKGSDIINFIKIISNIK